MTVTAALTEAQTQILEKLKGGFTPNFAPSTPEELLQEAADIAADIDAGRGVSVTVEEARAIAEG
jgi:cytosine/adenosine deaminase-related metal-dependent hydrolase